MVKIILIFQELPLISENPKNPPRGGGPPPYQRLINCTPPPLLNSISVRPWRRFAVCGVCQKMVVFWGFWGFVYNPAQTAGFSCFPLKWDCVPINSRNDKV